VSLLELGTSRITAALALDMAEELAADGPVVVVDDLPRRNLTRNAGERDGPIRIVDGAQNAAGPAPAGQRERRIGVGSVAPGTAWTDLGRLGPETVLVVRTGHANAWLHTVARQLADLQIPVIGVVLVDPDPRDRSDSTLWDELHTALRGRARPSRPSRRGATPWTAGPTQAPTRPASFDGLGNAGAVSRDDHQQR